MATTRQRADAAAAKGEAVDANCLCAHPGARVQGDVRRGASRAVRRRPPNLQGALKLLADNATYTADVVGYTDDVGRRGPT